MPGTPCDGGPSKPIPERLPSPWDPILPKLRGVVVYGGVVRPDCSGT